MMSKVEKAMEKFLKGYNCAQSVLYAFCEDLNLEEETALKIAGGFGGGMAGKQEVCGAVTGGIMVIGLKYGQGADDNKRAKEIAYNKTRELMDGFRERHGTCLCRELIRDCDLMTREGQRYFKEKNLLNSVCTPCVQSAVALLEQIMR
ncbi:MAG: hypothetical protein CVU57_02845 [Deltaproteobacteria bacterium HGW-Deltaproteobacteria-15]|jgi:C_GCAxxG_C_C family probable redox protein|nr:MAG: hypothetical protein CVU57_02845 [Deltaproteobacteria bacterium HGW-Deltaproteobacteria-15]